MSARKKLRAIMAGKRLVLMPGAYDALSARIIESEGFEALVAGGYAGIGSMLAQADMGQSNMRDYADHYARICAAVEVPVYVDADTGADIKRVLREVGGPHMATLSQAAGPKARSLEELEAAGVCAATFPSVALFAAAQAVRKVMGLLKRGNSLAPCQEYLIPLDDYYDLVGLKPLLAREENYDQAAAALARKRAAE